MRYRPNKPKRVWVLRSLDHADESKPACEEPSRLLSGASGLLHSYFPARIRYVVADGFYSKYKWVTGVVQLGFHSIGRLRSDANLKFLYDGPKSDGGVAVAMTAR
jgi:hypothetical protein